MQHFYPFQAEFNNFSSSPKGGFTFTLKQESLSGQIFSTSREIVFQKIENTNCKQSREAAKSIFAYINILRNNVVKPI